MQETVQKKNYRTVAFKKALRNQHSQGFFMVSKRRDRIRRLYLSLRRIYTLYGTTEEVLHTMGNSFAAAHPKLTSEWSEKNLPLTPDQITYGSNKKVWWTGACGHEWQASPKSRSFGEGCPICSGARVIPGINDLASLEPELASEWSWQNAIKPTEVSVGSHKQVLWKGRCGHEWKAVVKNRVSGSGCPYCAHIKVLACSGQAFL